MHTQCLGLSVIRSDALFAELTALFPAVIIIKIIVPKHYIIMM